MGPPHFLIIGAMKAGTTTLYRDLLRHPQIFFPLDKEPGCLADSTILTDPTVRSQYFRLFEAASPHQLCGDASTAYTKRPTYTGTPERAYALLGPNLKLIYLVRDPINRSISHHHHLLAKHGATAVPTSFDTAVSRYPEIINYSRYRFQLEPWAATFGQDQILVLSLEEYAINRSFSTSNVLQFLGLNSHFPKPLPRKAYNRRHSRSIPGRRLFLKLANSALYKNYIRHRIPNAWRHTLTQSLLTAQPLRTDPPTPSMRAHLQSLFQDDIRYLETWLPRGTFSYP